MALLNRNQIQEVVYKSLTAIADLPDDPEKATFTAFTNDQKHIFLSTLKRQINALPYYMNDGSTSYRAYYNVDLTPDSTDEWPTVGDCIDWIQENQKVVYL